MMHNAFPLPTLRAMRLYIAVLLLIFFSFNWPTLASGQRIALHQNLHPGLRIYRYDWSAESCVLYVAEMDRSYPGFHFESAVGGDTILGKETVRSMAHRRTQKGARRVLVAVNGGFGVLGDMKGYGGVLENLHIQNGELMTQPTDLEACFGVTADGEFLIGPVEMTAAATIASYTFPISCVNQRHLDDCQSILYTPRMGYSTHTHRKRAYEIVLTDLQLPIAGGRAATFVVSKFGKGGNNPIPEDGAVISFRSRFDKALASQLSEGQRGKLNVTLKPEIWNSVVHAIGGRLRLIANGEISPQLEKLHLSERNHTPGKRSANLVLSYEPRTALGYSDQKLILVVADGRRPGYSTGLSLYRLASLLLELGVTEAINLDGGSSSTFVVDGKVINRPSGQQERDVLNAAFITVDSDS